MRLLFITDFTEQFAYRLLRGILDYSKESEEPWVVCKMPPSFKREIGLDGVVKWAEQWQADVVIGQFDPDDDVSLFRRHGIVALAQGYIRKFDYIPNITSDYDYTGAIAAKHFLSRGFQNFGFLGYKGVCWSEGRYAGYCNALRSAGISKIYLNDNQKIDSLWYSDYAGLGEWLKTLPKPIAIMACDDNQGNVLLQACRAFGYKIPSEVSIIGVDNDEILCNLSAPTLSSINVDIERGGYEAAAMAAKMVKDPYYMGEDIILRPINIVSRMSSNVFATKDAAVLAALQYISANIDRKLMVTDVLKVVPMSRRLLEQRFLKETGSSIYQYITSLRMDRFAQLLLESNDSIANIAARLDEPDTKSISRRFTAVKGCTPSQFRKLEMRKTGV
ncbi:MAG: DNA-binding transcriptional regulator [Bacteroidales bacterium]|nr:DNA-binding transcriptional regulator [Bacteroidales bacterium]